MAMKKETIYLKAEQSVEVKQRDVTLGDIVKMECANPIVLPKLKTLKILSIPETGHHRYVISILKIIACIHEKYPMLEIQSLGEPDIILTYEDCISTPQLLRYHSQHLQENQRKELVLAL